MEMSRALMELFMEIDGIKYAPPIYDYCTNDCSVRVAPMFELKHDHPDGPTQIGPLDHCWVCNNDTSMWTLANGLIWSEVMA